MPGPYTEEQFKAMEIEDVDAILAGLLTEDFIQANQFENRPPHPYRKAESAQELLNIYNDPETVNQQKSAQTLSRRHDNLIAMQYRPEYLEMSKGSKLKRMTVYALNPSYLDYPEDSPKYKEILEENRRRCEAMKDEGAARKFLDGIKDELLKTDFSPIVSGDPKKVLDFMRQHPLMAEIGFIYENDFLPAYGPMPAEEKAILDRKAEQIKASAAAFGLASFIAGDYYPLLKNQGYDRYPNEIQAAIVQADTGKLGMNNYQKALKVNNDLMNGALYEAIDMQRVRDENVRKAFSSLLNGESNALEKAISEGRLSNNGKLYAKDEIPDTIFRDIRNSQTVTLHYPNLDKDGRIDTNAPDLINLKFKDGQPRINPVATEALDRLTAINDRLQQLGTRTFDSPEIKKFMTSLNSLVKNCRTTNTAQLMMDMSETAQAADNYYFAKLGQDHNETRSQRFEAAREIRTLLDSLKQGRLPEIAPDIRRQQILEDIATKNVYAELQVAKKLAHKNHDTAKEARYDDMLKNHQGILRSAAKMVREDKAFRYLFDDLGSEELLQIRSKEAMQIHKEYTQTSKVIAPDNTVRTENSAPEVNAQKEIQKAPAKETEPAPRVITGP